MSGFGNSSTAATKFRQALIIVASIFCAIAWSTPGQAAKKGWHTLASEPQPLLFSMGGEINGIIYVAGGYYIDGSSPSTALQAYDPATDTWTTLAPMPVALQAGAAGVIHGQLYVAGGDAGGYTPSNTLYVYDPPSNTWTQKANMPQASVCGTAGVIGGRLYVTSPFACTGATATSFDVYDPATDKWKALPAPPLLSVDPASAVIGGKFYIAGGGAADGGYDGTEVYDPKSKTWTQLTTMPTPVAYPGSTAMWFGSSGKSLWVFGGANGGCPLTLVQVYDPILDHWTTFSPAMPIARGGVPNVEVVKGIAYVVDGGDCISADGNNMSLVK